MYQFTDIIGQKAIVEHLNFAIRNHSVSHAYIINGESGSGRKTIARTLAATLQCESPVERDGYIEPCGKCLSCLQMMTNNQPDVITVTHEKTSGIGVGEIRKMRADIQIMPYANARKIYIIPDAEKLTVQAQNALLKTLEEPPEYANLILIADGISGFLPTILSRCVVLQIKSVAENAIERFLVEKHDIPEEQAHLMARFSGGNPGQALVLAVDEAFKERRDRILLALRQIKRMDSHALASLADSIEATARMEAIGFIQMWYRDVLCYKSGGSGDNLIFEGDIQYIKEAADHISYEKLGDILEAIDEALKRLHSNATAGMTIEMLLLSIREASA